MTRGTPRIFVASTRDDAAPLMELLAAAGLSAEAARAGETADVLVADDLPADVLVVGELGADLATRAQLAGARVCLRALGAAPLREAVLGTARDKEARRALEETIRDLEQRRTLVNVAVNDVIFRIDVEGERFRFRGINPMFSRTTGLPESKVVGQLVDDVIPEPSLGVVLMHYREAVAERRTVRWDEISSYPTGRKCGEVSITPVVNAQGHVTSLIGAVHDVTEERMLDEKLRLLADIVNAVQIGLSCWNVPDPDDPARVALAALNPEAERMFAFAPATSIGRPFIELFPSEAGRALLATICEVARDARMRELPAYRAVSGPLAQHTLAVKLFPLAGGERVGLVVEDVTAQARARALAAVEQRVFELTARGASIDETLAALVQAIDGEIAPSTASALIVSAGDGRIADVVAPGLSADVRRELAGLRLAEVPDALRRAGLHPGASLPIVVGAERVLGRFSLQHTEPRAPSAEDLLLVARASHAAAIALQRQALDEGLHGLSARIEAAREEERTGIAREIHDQLGQTITALKMELAGIARRAASAAGVTREALIDKVGALVRMTDEMIVEVRRISAELRPGILDDLGLVAALAWQAKEMEQRAPLTTVLRSDLDDRPLPRELATTAFRVFQEALTNVVRHAGATRVEVDVTERDGELVLTIRDDGKGIRDEDLHDPRSLGLLGMRERARRLGGSATFARATPTGTVVTLRLPLR